MLIELDPIVIFGDAIGSGAPGGADATIRAPDGGILPPAGRYLGTAAVDGQDAVPVSIVVPARVDGRLTGPHRDLVVRRLANGAWPTFGAARVRIERVQTH